LNREIVRLAKTEDVKTRLFKTGAEAVGSSPAELAALMKSDMVKFSKVIKDAGIKVD
jgi:tripartite-type tricarboxylate transporter receptor subunit TctC